MKAARDPSRAHWLNQAPLSHLGRQPGPITSGDGWHPPRRLESSQSHRPLPGSVPTTRSRPLVREPRAGALSSLFRPDGGFYFPCPWALPPPPPGLPWPWLSPWPWPLECPWP